MSATDANYCPKCKEFCPLMSGVKLIGHEEYPLYLCFKCKEWRDSYGKFVQTI